MCLSQDRFGCMEQSLARIMSRHTFCCASHSWSRVETRPEANTSIFWCRNTDVLSLRIEVQEQWKEEAAVGGRPQ